MTIIADSTSGLVPQRRLGALLAERRDLVGYTIDDMARRSMGQFTAGDLEAIEAGLIPLGDAAIEALGLLYEFNSMPPSAQRSRLIIAEDEDTGHVADIDEFSDELLVNVLRRYVALLYLLRGRPIGEPLPLRSDDAEMLALAFDRTEDEVRDLLNEMMLNDMEIITEYADRMRRRLVVPAAGLLVGPTPAGMLVVVK